MKRRSIDENIASIIGSESLASAIRSSTAPGLACSSVHLVGGKTVWDIFKRSLNAASRDIEKHPRGKLFRRLIEYGPHNPADPEALTGDGETTLSDPEGGLCVEFIFSHMVNRFKGELAELLALDPCIGLIQRLQRGGQLASDSQLYWGEMVQERRQTGRSGAECSARWGSFTKGADGLLVEQTPVQRGKLRDVLKMRGVIEVKSMTCPRKKVINQINRHIVRLGGGVKLGGREWSPEDIDLSLCNSIEKNNPGLIRIMVLPATWRLSREWHSANTDQGRKIVFPEHAQPPIRTRTEEMEPNLWKVTLAWSQEALDQAAYEMTFWYMSQVGSHVYTKRKMPQGWEYMIPEQAGYNAIKMMLYYMPLRHVSKRQERLATKLYNVYCFGYPLGVDSREMLWPEDFSDEDQKQKSAQLHITPHKQCT